MKSYNDFLDTFDSPNTMRVAKSMGTIAEYDYENVTPVDVENIILKMNPNSIKAITTICYVFGMYAKYIGNEDLRHMVHDVDRNMLWFKAKKTAEKKFISNDMFNDVYREIGVYEEYNSFYIQTLFRCLYEGIYNDDMSVLKNLRASDVNGNNVTLRNDDGDEYSIGITDRLADSLISLGGIDIWERRNRYGSAKIKIDGLYSDSCFKVENRKGGSEYSYRYTYYRILRKIAKEYLEYNLLPLQLYVSGIMNRIESNLREEGISLEDAFVNKSKDRKASRIITDELERSHCGTEARNFREMVKGHLDVFGS